MRRHNKVKIAILIEGEESFDFRTIISQNIRLIVIESAAWVKFDVPFYKENQFSLWNVNYLRVILTVNDFLWQATLDHFDSRHQILRLEIVYDQQAHCVTFQVSQSSSSHARSDVKIQLYGFRLDFEEMRQQFGVCDSQAVLRRDVACEQISEVRSLG